MTEFLYQHNMLDIKNKHKGNQKSRYLLAKFEMVGMEVYNYIYKSIIYRKVVRFWKSKVYQNFL